MEYNVAIKNKVYEGFLSPEKRSQRNSKWDKLDQNMFCIMLNMY